ncbi:hypothetical protein NC653_040199 [Populus alba x Populus x berolinensis]|uniref:Uncharacterized protein n=1 Tax=Populus alba x Populus x berolinensis TaxID=444605 RepID=A0AAD6PSB2_9ROSI|nr:hypothetical protein NC653_040199 [Populus alba x Populus x berolinensis]
MESMGIIHVGNYGWVVLEAPLSAVPAHGYSKGFTLVSNWSCHGWCLEVKGKAFRLSVNHQQLAHHRPRNLVNFFKLNDGDRHERIVMETTFATVN